MSNYFKMAFWRTGKKKKEQQKGVPPVNLFSDTENDPFAETYEDANSWRAEKAEVGTNTVQ